MFFELDDVQRRHNPTWWTNNVTSWTRAVDSTPSWNYQRGKVSIIQVLLLDLLQGQCSNILVILSITLALCFSTMNLLLDSINGELLLRKLVIFNLSEMDLKAECNLEHSLEHFQLVHN